MNLQIVNSLAHILFGFVITFFFGFYGITFIAGYVVGSEFMQMCYRSFKDGYKWRDIYLRPWILYKYAHISDTAIDILTYSLGILAALGLKQII